VIAARVSVNLGPKACLPTLEDGVSHRKLLNSCPIWILLNDNSGIIDAAAIRDVHCLETADKREPADHGRHEPAYLSFSLLSS
jgi:hypothetical protein